MGTGTETMDFDDGYEDSGHGIIEKGVRSKLSKITRPFLRGLGSSKLSSFLQDSFTEKVSNALILF
jgi:hypothetical protein